jgi:hypothetical protein
VSCCAVLRKQLEDLNLRATDCQIQQKDLPLVILDAKRVKIAWLGAKIKQLDLLRRGLGGFGREKV